MSFSRCVHGLSEIQGRAIQSITGRGVDLQIASHLLPLDLLHLARVSKHLRSLMLARNSKYVWVAARNNVDPALPEPPVHISEPYYASFVFELHCTVSPIGNCVFAFDFIHYLSTTAVLRVAVIR